VHDEILFVRGAVCDDGRKPNLDKNL
jgi:hypothetical protein